MTASDLFDIAGKTALVTGGSRGIGLMIAEGFVDAGVKVYISSRKADVVRGGGGRSSPKKGTCIGIPADLSTEAECRRLADEMAAHEDALDILVNNAGATWGAPLEDFDEAAFERVLALNVKGVFHLTKFLVPAAAGGGHGGRTGPGHQHRVDRRDRGARPSRRTPTRPRRQPCTS